MVCLRIRARARRSLKIPRWCFTFVSYFCKGRCVPLAKNNLTTRCATFSNHPPFRKQATPQPLSQKGNRVCTSLSLVEHPALCPPTPKFGGLSEFKVPQIWGLAPAASQKRGRERLKRPSEDLCIHSSPERREAKTRLGSPSPKKGKGAGDAVRCCVAVGYL